MYLDNKVVCNICKDVIQSFHRHDFKWCSCKTTAVDGGTDYLKRSGDNYTELSTIDNGDHETRRNIIRWGQRTDKKNNPLTETKWVLIKDLDSSHIESILMGSHCKNTVVLETLVKELKQRK